MHRSTIIIISILAIFMLAGSLLSDTIYVHVTNTCDVKLTVTESGDVKAYWEFTAYPNQNNSRSFPPIAGFTYLAVAEGERTVGGTVTYTDSDSGYLSLTHPDNLHLYLDVSGKIPDDPPAGD